VKVYTSAVVIIPPEEKWASIQIIRKKYDRQINRWMPHITLLYPFKPENEYSRFEIEFSEKCKQIQPFEISLKKFKYFPHGKEKYTIWLDPEPNDLIISFQSELLKIVPDCSDVNKFKKGFTPHLSVGQVIGRNKLDKLMSKLQRNWNEVVFSLNQIYFISRGESKTSRFEISKEIKLNG